MSLPGVRLVLLPEIVRQIGMDKIPEKIIGLGYIPEEGPQVAVFGEVDVLETWRKELGLQEEEYPVHTASESSMGPHIDVYGKEMVGKVSEGQRVENFMDFAKSRRA